jgi:hypothetical protein
MVNREDIRNYFSRCFLGRIPVRSFQFNERKVCTLKLSKNILVHKGVVKAKIISPLKFVCGKLACVSNGMRIKSLFIKVLGDRIKSYASGEIKAKKIPLKTVVKLRKWQKKFALLPQERRNRLTFIPKSERIIYENEFNLAYFQPIIHDNVIKLVLNKQNGSLFIWYNAIGKCFETKGLYMYKRLGEKDIDWRWVDLKSNLKK